VALNGFDAVLLQHEYGLFGGRDGEQVLDLIHGLEVPVLTWGLLSPGKGIEHGIAAIARLGIHSPAISYIVAGETHPKVRAVQGEQYRNSLKAQALALGVADHVRFDDAYRDWKSLAALVRTVDVVLLPYDSRDQVSSGVLVEALASGKPVIATRFPHAVELLADGAGILVDHGDVEGIAHALERVLYERDLAGRMASAARVAATPLLWPAVGASYRSLVNSVVAQRAATTSVSPCSIRVMPADSMGSDDTG
jgi:glycosyltransferase involved in cell wall biosynthesis